jgi:hypothetical protein
MYHPFIHNKIIIFKLNLNLFLLKENWLNRDHLRVQEIVKKALVT